ncbi:MAG: hypothetical protein FJ102_24715 [Deltaproteobacteria bacterium]|nr:hypothetical protein [Deltaproteobacteria bacterium]
MFLLLGCASIAIDDAGLFPALSAFSYPSWDVEGIGPSGREASATSMSTDHAVSFTDATLGCIRAQGYQAAWNDASEALLDASDDGTDAEAMCEGMPDFLDRMDEANRNYPAEMQRLSFGFCVEGGDDASCGGDVEPGEYALGEQADMGGGEGSVYGYYWRDRQAEEPALADYWVEEDCGFDFISMSEDDENDGEDSYQIEGTITITGGDGQVLAGSWEGTLAASEEGQGLDGAETSGTFSTTRCDVEQPDTLVVWWL